MFERDADAIFTVYTLRYRYFLLGTAKLLTLNGRAV
jgi:hypothetical protein